MDYREHIFTKSEMEEVEGELLQDQFDADCLLEQWRKGTLSDAEFMSQLHKIKEAASDSVMTVLVDRRSREEEFGFEEMENIS